MDTFECPQCHAPASFSGQQAYCPKCGWRAGKVVSQFRITLKISPWFFPVLLLFVAAIFVLHDRKGLSGIQLGFVLGVPLVLALLLARRGAVKLVCQVPAGALAGAAAPAVDSVPAPAAVTVAPELEALLEVPPPRAIRMSRSGKATLATVLTVLVGAACALLAIIYARREQFSSLTTMPGNLWLLAGLIFAAALALFALQRKCARQRDLLVSGQIAIARVTAVIHGKNTYVHYEYQDAVGRTFKKSGSLLGGKIIPGMSVPVFYDRENPDRQVAACCCYYEVAPPGAA